MSILSQRFPVYAAQTADQLKLFKKVGKNCPYLVTIQLCQKNAKDNVTKNVDNDEDAQSNLALPFVECLRSDKLEIVPNLVNFLSKPFFRHKL